jgi:putative hydrolase
MPTPHAATPRRYADINAVVGGLLRDLAYVQTSPERVFGYKRAASAVLSLERPLTELRRSNGTLEKIPGIGPASSRVILEVLDMGTSPTVERTVELSGRAEEIHARRGLRAHFLSRAEVLRILSDDAFDGPRPEDYHGDLQMHSEWSDGSPTLDEIVEACVARGYRFAAVTDHSYGLKIAGGMSMDTATEQWRAIDRLNATASGRFRLIRGIEANIGTDGALDLSADEAAQFELVLAAPHSRLRKADDQTSRLLAAIRTPHVHVLAHPRGRISGSRAGVMARWEEVFAEAAQRGVAIEIDGDPARQDLDHTLATQALAAGCLFALDSDAHTTLQLRYAETALAHARLAGIPPDRIVNCWPTERLLEWLESGRHKPDTTRSG